MLLKIHAHSSFGFVRAPSKDVTTQFQEGHFSMNCKATIRLICEYLEGRLTPGVASEVQRHLSNCNNCRTVFDAASLTLEVYFDREVEFPAAHHHTRVA